MIADLIQFSVEKATTEGEVTFVIVILLLAAFLVWLFFMIKRK
jgi:hypothetical protein